MEPYLSYTCTSCRRDLPLSEFHKSKSKRNGHEKRCKECRKEYRAAYHQEHRAKSLKVNRAYKKKAWRTSRDNARNLGNEWTGADIEFAIREDMSVAEIAAILGRTCGSIHDIRYKARRLPREAFLAGQRSEMSKP